MNLKNRILKNIENKNKSEEEKIQAVIDYSKNFEDLFSFSDREKKEIENSGGFYLETDIGYFNGTFNCRSFYLYYVSINIKEIFNGYLFLGISELNIIEPGISCIQLVKERGQIDGYQYCIFTDNGLKIFKERILAEKIIGKKIENKNTWEPDFSDKDFDVDDFLA